MQCTMATPSRRPPRPAPSTASASRTEASGVSGIEQTVARRVAALRREVGMTLKEFGEKTGLSDAYLSRVENGHAALTIASLAKIADVFATPLATFFEDAEQPARIVICRAGAGRVVRFRGRSGTLVSLLAEPKQNKLMEPLIVDVATAPGDVPLKAHPGEEFNYVIEGRCRFLFGTDEHVLEAGDSVYFDATTEHAVRAIDRQPCRLLAIVSSRDFQIHRNISKVVEGRIQA